MAYYLRPLYLGIPLDEWVYEWMAVKFFAARRMVRNASFIAAMFGNAVAISDSSTTIFEVIALSADLPRTNLSGKSESTSSLYNVSLLGLVVALVFLI